MPDHATIKILLDAFQALSGYGGQASVQLLVDARLSEGLTANCFNHIHYSERKPGATTAEDVDLRLLEDAEGDAMVGLDEIVFLAVQAPSANTANYEIKPSAANGLTCFLKDPTDIIVVPPGETKVLVYNPALAKNVVDATHKSLNINNLGNAASVLHFYMLGRSI